jgi:hypothetical protein
MPQDVCFSDLKFIIEFVYRGEIDVSQAELQVCNNYFAFFSYYRLQCSCEPVGPGFMDVKGTTSAMASKTYLLL